MEVTRADLVVDCAEKCFFLLSSIPEKGTDKRFSYDQLLASSWSAFYHEAPPPDFLLSLSLSERNRSSSAYKVGVNVVYPYRHPVAWLGLISERTTCYSYDVSLWLRIERSRKYQVRGDLRACLKTNWLKCEETVKQDQELGASVHQHSATAMIKRKRTARVFPF